MNPQYRFEFRRVTWRRDRYYHRSWEDAVPVTVQASTEGEARKKALALSPELNDDWVYGLGLISVNEVESEPESEKETE